MFEVYVEGNENFEKNGDTTLSPSSCIFTHDMNGTIQIELTHKFDKLGKWKYLVNENIIACPTPYSEKQLFRIYDLEKDFDGVRVFARHIFFDLRHKTLIDVRPTDKNGEQALNYILSDTKFRGHSNIYLIETAYYVRKNIIEAINGSEDQSFMNRWGGELSVDNFDITINDRIGSDKGVKIAFGRNLDSIEETINTDDVVTRIIPIGYDGIMLEGDEPWIDSPLTNKYSHVKEKVIKFEEVKVASDEGSEGFATIEEAREELIRLSELQFENGIDKPTVNYKVQMIELSQTTAYKKYKVLETVVLGDTLECIHEDIDIEVKARCIGIKWDCIKRKYEEIEIGNFISNYFDKQTQTTAIVEKAAEKAGQTYTREEVNAMLEKYITTDLMNTYVKNSDLSEKLKSYVKNTLLERILQNYLTSEETIKKIESKITEALVDYVTTKDLKEKYLVNYQTEEDLTNALKGYLTETKLNTALESYITRQVLDEMLNDYVLETSINDIIDQAISNKTLDFISEETFNTRMQQIEERLKNLESEKGETTE